MFAAPDYVIHFLSLVFKVKNAPHRCPPDLELASDRGFADSSAEQLPNLLRI